MSTEQILDLIIDYAYTRKKEIEKHRVLLGTQQTNPSRQIDDAKIIEIDSWIKFLIDVKKWKIRLIQDSRGLAQRRKEEVFLVYGFIVFV